MVTHTTNIFPLFKFYIGGHYLLLFWLHVLKMCFVIKHFLNFVLFVIRLTHSSSSAFINITVRWMTYFLLAFRSNNVVVLYRLRDTKKCFEIFKPLLPPEILSDGVV